MSPEDIPYIHPSKRDEEFLRWQERFIREICGLFRLSKEEIEGRIEQHQTDLGYTFHADGAFSRKEE